MQVSIGLITLGQTHRKAYVVVTLQVVSVSFTSWQSTTYPDPEESCDKAERKQYAVLKLDGGEMKVELLTRAVKYRNGTEMGGGKDVDEEELWRRLLKKAPELKALKTK